jgi:hypothetical protein
MLTEILETVPAASHAAKVEMVFRIWHAGGKDAEAAGNEQENAQQQGTLALIEDVVGAKHGVLHATKTQIFATGLPHANDALVAARRIQLGLQGFRARAGAAPVAVSIAIDASSSAGSGAGRQKTVTIAEGDASVQAGSVAEASHDLLTLLKISKPAQVLLTHDLCQSSPAIKGLPLKAFPARFGVYEYQWTSAEKLEVLQAEPQLMLATVPAAPPSAPAARPTAETATQTIPAVVAVTAPASPPRSEEMVRDGRQTLRLARIAVFAGLGVVVIGLASFVGMRLARESAKPAGSGSAPVTVPAAVPAAPAQPAAQTTPTSAAPGASSGTGSAPAAQPAKSQSPRKAAQEKHATEPAQPTAECNLQGALSQYLGLAEQARGRGDYANAIRRFKEILSCDPNNGAAREGLNRAIQGQEQSRHQ